VEGPRAVKHEEEDSFLRHFRYPRAVEDGFADVTEAVIRSILLILYKRSMYVVDERQKTVI
jgi:hypothetical protein